MRVARSAILALLTVAVFAPGIARAAGSIVLVRSGDETIQTYLALPEKPAKGGPAIVLVHEWWG